jgi:hypothetical protein
VCLKNAHTIVVVNDQTRKVISFTVNKAIAVSGNSHLSRIFALSRVKPASHTHFKCTRKHIFPEISTQCTLIEAQYTNGNRAYLIVTISKEFAIRSVYSHNIAL